MKFIFLLYQFVSNDSTEAALYSAKSMSGVFMLIYGLIIVAFAYWYRNKKQTSNEK